MATSAQQNAAITSNYLVSVGVLSQQLTDLERLVGLLTQVREAAKGKSQTVEISYVLKNAKAMQDLVDGLPKKARKAGQQAETELLSGVGGRKKGGKMVIEMNLGASAAAINGLKASIDKLVTTLGKDGIKINGGGGRGRRSGGIGEESSTLANLEEFGGKFLQDAKTLTSGGKKLTEARVKKLREDRKKGFQGLNRLLRQQDEYLSTVEKTLERRGTLALQDMEEYRKEASKSHEEQLEFLNAEKERIAQRRLGVQRTRKQLATAYQRDRTFSPTLSEPIRDTIDHQQASYAKEALLANKRKRDKVLQDYEKNLVADIDASIKALQRQIEQAPVAGGARTKKANQLEPQIHRLQQERTTRIARAGRPDTGELDRVIQEFERKLKAPNIDEFWEMFNQIKRPRRKGVVHDGSEQASSTVKTPTGGRNAGAVAGDLGTTANTIEKLGTHLSQALSPLAQLANIDFSKMAAGLTAIEKAVAQRSNLLIDPDGNHTPVPGSYAATYPGGVPRGAGRRVGESRKLESLAEVLKTAIKSDLNAGTPAFDRAMERLNEQLELREESQAAQDLAAAGLNPAEIRRQRELLRQGVAAVPLSRLRKAGGGSFVPKDAQETLIQDAIADKSIAAVKLGAPYNTIDKIGGNTFPLPGSNIKLNDAIGQFGELRVQQQALAQILKDAYRKLNDAGVRTVDAIEYTAKGTSRGDSLFNNASEDQQQLLKATRQLQGKFASIIKQQQEVLPDPETRRYLRNVAQFEEGSGVIGKREFAQTKAPTFSEFLGGDDFDKKQRAYLEQQYLAAVAGNRVEGGTSVANLLGNQRGADRAGTPSPFLTKKARETELKRQKELRDKYIRENKDSLLVGFDDRKAYDQFIDEKYNAYVKESQGVPADGYNATRGRGVDVDRFRAILRQLGATDVADKLDPSTSREDVLKYIRGNFSGLLNKKLIRQLNNEENAPQTIDDILAGREHSPTVLKQREKATEFSGARSGAVRDIILAKAARIRALQAGDIGLTETVADDQGNRTTYTAKERDFLKFTDTQARRLLQGGGDLLKILDPLRAVDLQDGPSGPALSGTRAGIYDAIKQKKLADVVRNLNALKTEEVAPQFFTPELEAARLAAQQAEAAAKALPSIRGIDRILKGDSETRPGRYDPSATPGANPSFDPEARRRALQRRLELEAKITEIKGPINPQNQERLLGQGSFALGLVADIDKQLSDLNTDLLSYSEKREKGPRGHALGSPRSRRLEELKPQIDALQRLRKQKLESVDLAGATDKITAAERAELAQLDAALKADAEATASSKSAGARRTLLSVLGIKDDGTTSSSDLLTQARAKIGAAQGAARVASGKFFGLVEGVLGVQPKAKGPEVDPTILGAYDEALKKNPLLKKLAIEPGTDVATLKSNIDNIEALMGAVREVSDGFAAAHKPKPIPNVRLLASKLNEIIELDAHITRANKSGQANPTFFEPDRGLRGLIDRHASLNPNSDEAIALAAKIQQAQADGSNKVERDARTLLESKLKQLEPYYSTGAGIHGPLLRQAIFDQVRSKHDSQIKEQLKSEQERLDVATSKGDQPTVADATTKIRALNEQLAVVAATFRKFSSGTIAGNLGHIDSLGQPGYIGARENYRATTPGQPIGTHAVGAGGGPGSGYFLLSGAIKNDAEGIELLKKNLLELDQIKLTGIRGVFEDLAKTVGNVAAHLQLVRAERSKKNQPIYDGEFGRKLFDTDGDFKKRVINHAHDRALEWQEQLDKRAKRGARGRGGQDPTFGLKTTFFDKDVTAEERKSIVDEMAGWAKARDRAAREREQALTREARERYRAGRREGRIQEPEDVIAASTRAAQNLDRLRKAADRSREERLQIYAERTAELRQAAAARAQAKLDDREKFRATGIRALHNPQAARSYRESLGQHDPELLRVHTLEAQARHRERQERLKEYEARKAEISQRAAARILAKSEDRESVRNTGIHALNNPQAARAYRENLAQHDPERLQAEVRAALERQQARNRAERERLLKQEQDEIARGAQRAAAQRDTLEGKLTPEDRNASIKVAASQLKRLSNLQLALRQQAFVIERTRDDPQSTEHQDALKSYARIGTSLAGQSDLVGAHLSSSVSAFPNSFGRLAPLAENYQLAQQNRAQFERLVRRRLSAQRVLDDPDADPERRAQAQKRADNLDARFKGEGLNNMEEVRKELDRLVIKEGEHTRHLQGAAAVEVSAIERRERMALGIERISRAFQNVLLYSGASLAVFGFFSAISQGVSEAIELERALARVQGILKSKSGAEREVIRQGVLDLSQQYGVKPLEVLGNVQVFAQAGLAGGEALDAARASIRAQLGAGLEPQQAQEMLVAIRNISQGNIGFEDIVDRISRVESQYAVSAPDLSVALQRTGSLAKQLNPERLGQVDFADLIIGLTTSVVEKTRITGNQAGTGIKFILSRLAAPDIGAQLQDKFGIALAGDQGGKELRPLLDILSDIGARYTQLRDNGESVKASQLLQTVAGARQVNVAAALFEDFNRTLQIAVESGSALGDTQARVAIGLDTLGAQIDRVKVGFSAFSANLFEKTGLLRGLAGSSRDGAGVLNRAAANPGSAIAISSLLGLGLSLGAGRRARDLDQLQDPTVWQRSRAGAYTFLANGVAPGLALSAIVGVAATVAQHVEERRRRIRENEEAFGLPSFTRADFVSSDFYKNYERRAIDLGGTPEGVFAAVREASVRARIATEGATGRAGLFNTDQRLAPVQGGDYDIARKAFLEALVGDPSKGLLGTLPALGDIADEAERMRVAMDLLADSMKFGTGVAQAQAEALDSGVRDRLAVAQKNLDSGGDALTEEQRKQIDLARIRRSRLTLGFLGTAAERALGKEGEETLRTVNEISSVGGPGYREALGLSYTRQDAEASSRQASVSLLEAARLDADAILGSLTGGLLGKNDIDGVGGLLSRLRVGPGTALDEVGRLITEKGFTVGQALDELAKQFHVSVAETAQITATQQQVRRDLIEQGRAAGRTTPIGEREERLATIDRLRLGSPALAAKAEQQLALDDATDEFLSARFNIRGRLARARGEALPNESTSGGGFGADVFLNRIQSRLAVAVQTLRAAGEDTGDIEGLNALFLNPDSRGRFKANIQARRGKRAARDELLEALLSFGTARQTVEALGVAAGETGENDTRLEENLNLSRTTLRAVTQVPFALRNKIISINDRIYRSPSVEQAALFEDLEGARPEVKLKAQEQYIQQILNQELPGDAAADLARQGESMRDALEAIRNNAELFDDLRPEDQESIKAQLSIGDNRVLALNYESFQEFFKQLVREDAQRLDAYQASVEYAKHTNVLARRESELRGQLTDAQFTAVQRVQDLVGPRAGRDARLDVAVNRAATLRSVARAAFAEQTTFGERQGETERARISRRAQLDLDIALRTADAQEALQRSTVELDAVTQALTTSMTRIDQSITAATQGFRTVFGSFATFDQAATTGGLGGLGSALLDPLTLAIRNSTADATSRSLFGPEGLLRGPLASLFENNEETEYLKKQFDTISKGTTEGITVAFDQLRKLESEAIRLAHIEGIREGFKAVYGPNDGSGYNPAAKVGAKPTNAAATTVAEARAKTTLGTTSASFGATALGDVAAAASFTLNKRRDGNNFVITDVNGERNKWGVLESTLNAYNKETGQNIKLEDLTEQQARKIFDERYYSKVTGLASGGRARGYLSDVAYQRGVGIAQSFAEKVKAQGLDIDSDAGFEALVQADYALQEQQRQRGLDPATIARAQAGDARAKQFVLLAERHQGLLSRIRERADTYRNYTGSGSAITGFQRLRSPLATHRLTDLPDLVVGSGAPAGQSEFANYVNTGAGYSNTHQHLLNSLGMIDSMKDGMFGPLRDRTDRNGVRHLSPQFLAAQARVSYYRNQLGAELPGSLFSLARSGGRYRQASATIPTSLYAGINPALTAGARGGYNFAGLSGFPIGINPALTTGAVGGAYDFGQMALMGTNFGINPGLYAQPRPRFDPQSMGYKALMAGAGLVGQIGGSYAARLTGGRGNRFGELGASLGSQFGATALKAAAPKLFASLGILGGPLGGIAGGIVGGLLGGLFGGKKTPPEIGVLERIDRNTKETIAAINNQTGQLLNLDNRLLNVPASFAVPSYRPLAVGSGQASAQAVQVTQNVQITVSGAQNARVTAQEIRAALKDEFRRAGSAYNPTST